MNKIMKNAETGAAKTNTERKKSEPAESGNLTLRPIQKKDYPCIEGIIRKTWKYDGLSRNPKDAQNLSRLYLRSCLKRASFSCVAAEGEKVYGVILAGSKKSLPRVQAGKALSQLFAVLRLFTTRTGRRIGKFFERFDQTDAELLKSCGKNFDAEICFFAVDESSRGLGIGKKLFSAALNYLKSEQVKSLYLFTDSSCTYQFYERRGMKRLGETVVELKPHTDYRLHMFIYGLTL